MSNTGANIKPEAVRETAFGDITANYTKMSSDPINLPDDPIKRPVRIFYIANTTNQDVYISFDGITNQYRVESDSFKVLDLKANDLFLDVGNYIYVKAVGSLPTSGLVYAEVTTS